MGIKLPDDFVKRMEATLGDEAADFFAALDEIPPVSVRFNPVRNRENEYLPIANQVPWESNAYYLRERPSFTYDPSFHAGLYYVQEASSMLIGQIIDQLPGREEWRLALDLCAAPGGKSTHLISKLPENVFLLANEVTSSRLGALRQNIIKWGYPNSAVLNYSVEKIAGSGLLADLLLVDAPCSGEGLFRKDPESINHWTAENLEKCELRQHDILSYAPAIVRENGFMVYSTCTYYVGENMNHVLKCVKSGYFEYFEIQVNDEFKVKKVEKDGIQGYQCYPHKLRGEGFFFACLRRTNKSFENRSPSKIKPDSGYRNLNKEDISTLPDFLQDYKKEVQIDREGNYYYAPEALQNLQLYMNIRPLFDLGQLKGKDFIPGHGLAMMQIFKKVFPVLSLNYEDAIRYLKKETIDHKNFKSKGWHFVSYNGNNIGLVKILENRINNYLPTNLRILK